LLRSSLLLSPRRTRRLRGFILRNRPLLVPGQRRRGRRRPGAGPFRRRARLPWRRLLLHWRPCLPWRGLLFRRRPGFAHRRLLLSRRPRFAHWWLLFAGRLGFADWQPCVLWLYGEVQRYALGPIGRPHRGTALGEQPRLGLLPLDLGFAHLLHLSLHALA